ncbi:unnamed protein product [Meganyctiphanes norvegica]|uniref:Uncharacterized protein n=1 Tax=Meganyctiphanes norvegica TaxID=48144 RepID=A0AAV2QMN3_MEGNR
MFLVSMTWLVVASLYVHGVRKTKYHLLLPMIVWQGIHMAIVFLLFVFILGSAISSGIPVDGALTILSVYLGLFAWDFCVFCVLRTNYLEIGRGTADIPMVLHNSDDKSFTEAVVA